MLALVFIVMCLATAVNLVSCVGHYRAMLRYDQLIGEMCTSRRQHGVAWIEEEERR